MLRRNTNRNSASGKKIPVKGTPDSKEKETKETICSECGNSRSYANKTKKLCAVCVKRISQDKIRVKKQVLRQKKAETITQAKLDQVTSWLIRAAFAEKCHACEVQMPRKQLQCCHFVSRTKSMTRFDLRNMLPGCPTCNMYTPHHVWNLGKSINKIWGSEMTETLLTLAPVSLKMNNNDRKEIYEIYKRTLNEIENNSLSSKERFVLVQDAYIEYTRITHKLVKL